MEPDEALSFALKKLAEDVVKECDQSFSSREEKIIYEENISSGATAGLPPLCNHVDANSDAPIKPRRLVSGQVSEGECPSNMPKEGQIHSEYVKGSATEEDSFTEINGDHQQKSLVTSPAMVNPPPNIDPQDPSFLAIREAFSRCLKEIQELKNKLALAVREIGFLKQSKAKEHQANGSLEYRDIGTETDLDISTSTCSAPELPIKEEIKLYEQDVMLEEETSHTLPSELTKGEGILSDSSSSEIIINKRNIPRRQNARKVTRRSIVITSEEEGNDVDENFMGDGGVSSANEEDDIKMENLTVDDPLNTIKTELKLSPTKISRRKSVPRKKTNMRKKKTANFHACEICFKSYSRAIDLRKHQLTHSKRPDNSYECEICKATFKRFADIEKHSRTHRRASEVEPTAFPCSKCDKVLPDRLALKRHKKSHPRLCPICNLSISCKNFSTHLRGHTGEKPYKCNQCTMTFVGPKHLARHLRVHTGVKPYACTECNKTFSEPGALRTHTRRHTGERPYICETCGKAFAQLTGLTYHIRTHTGEKPYKCDVCDKSFAQVTGLENHKRTHTGEKPYCCDICGRCFAVAITFTQHKRTHTGEKPYKCDVCSRAFTTGGALHRHKVIHAGVKPHVCVVCTVAFARLGDLQRHVRIHTGVRPYKCETCGKAFSRRSHLQAHGNTHGDKRNLRPTGKAQANLGAHLQVEAAAERPIDRLIERPIDRPMDRLMDRPMDRSIDRPMDRPLDRPMDRPIDRPIARPIDRPMDRSLDRPMDKFMERPLNHQLDRQMEHTLEHERAMMEQGAINAMSQRGLSTDETTPMYLGLGGRSQQEMVYPNRPVFPDRMPSERHTVTPDSSTAYHDRGALGPERRGVGPDRGMSDRGVIMGGDQRGRGPGGEQERPGSVQDRPGSLQDYMPAMPSQPINMAPGHYPPWNFNFQ